MIRCKDSVRRVAVPAAFLWLLALPAGLLAGEGSDLDWARENRAKGQYAEAVKLYEKAIEKAAPEAKPAIVQEMARARRATGQYAEAIKDVEDLLKGRPKDAAALTLHGELLVDVGRYEEAGKAFDAAIAADEKNLRAKAHRKLLADMLGDKPLSKKLTDFFFKYWEDNFDELTSDKIDDPLRPMYVGMAFEGENPKDAYEVCYAQAQDALKKRKKFDEEPFLYSARLALEKYDFGKAAKDFQAVLTVNPKQPDAMLGMALTMAQVGQGDRQRVQEALTKVFEVNPKHVDARVALAWIYLDENRDLNAAHQIEQALEVNPNSLRALSLRAAVLLNKGEAAGFDEACRKVLSINPKYAELYCSIGDSLEHKRRFRPALEHFQKATELDPEYWRGHYCLGMSMVRLGEEEKGRERLTKAYKMNGFNVWAYNMLRAVDKILGVPEQGVEPQFRVYRGGNFVTKVHDTEAGVLNLYATEIQERAWDKTTKKIGFAPKSPVIIEYFPTHGDFSARTVGLPGLGALGCCFGEMITILSPKVAADKIHPPFNWCKVVEHEFTHSVTLQMTDYRVSRWATEGFSTYLEGDEQTHWDPLLIDAMYHKKLLPISKLEEGFQRQDFPGRIQLTYFQVQLLMEYLDKTYGWDCLAKILKGYKDGKKDEEILRDATGKSLDELDKGFMEWLTKVKTAQVPLHPNYDPADIVALEKAAADNPQDAAKQADLAVAYFRTRKIDSARAAADKALAADGKNLEALTIKGMIAYYAEKNWNAAKEAFLKAVEAPGNSFLAWQHLGLLYKKEAATTKAIEAFEKARALYPRHGFEDNPYHHLHDLYLETGEKDKALKVMLDCLRIHVSDFEACKKALKTALELNRLEDAAEAAWAGNMVNPLDKKFHTLAGQAYEKAKNWPAAEREYSAATTMDQKLIPGWLGLARSRLEQNKKAEALAAVSRVLDIDATHAEAKALRGKIDGK